MSFWSNCCSFITAFGIYSWCSYILHVIHLLLRQSKSFRIYAENFHLGGCANGKHPGSFRSQPKIGFPKIEGKKEFSIPKPDRIKQRLQIQTATRARITWTNTDESDWLISPRTFLYLSCHKGKFSVAKRKLLPSRLCCCCGQEKRQVCQITWEEERFQTKEAEGKLMVQWICFPRMVIKRAKILLYVHPLLQLHDNKIFSCTGYIRIL